MQPDHGEVKIQILDVEDEDQQAVMDKVRANIPQLSEIAKNHNIAALLVTPGVRERDPLETSYEAFFVVRRYDGDQELGKLIKFTLEVEDRLGIKALPYNLGDEDLFLDEFELTKPYERILY